jgi:hypothetical protein
MIESRDSRRYTVASSITSALAELSQAPFANPMKTRLIVICSLAVCLCSCSQPTPSGKETSDVKKDAGAGGTSPEQAAETDKRGTFFELIDKSDLKVVTDPWPAKAGAAILKAEVTADDDGEKFAGTVAYRLSPTEQSSAAWQPMPKVRDDKDKSVYFEVPITLNQGSVYIQFRVSGAGEKAYNKEFTDLTDWKVDVK